MPKHFTDPAMRRIQISIPQGLLAEAGACGCATIEAYITYLKQDKINAVDKKQSQYLAMRRAYEELLKTTEDTSTNQEDIDKLLKASETPQETKENGASVDSTA